MWTNPEVVMRAFLLEQDPTLSFSVETFKDLKEQLPFHRITTVGGFDDGFTDTSVFDIESFASTRFEAGAQAEEMRMLILSTATKADTLQRWLIDTIRTTARPRWVDFRNSRIQRYVATYEVAMRLS